MTPTITERPKSRSTAALRRTTVLLLLSILAACGGGGGDAAAPPQTPPPAPPAGNLPPVTAFSAPLSVVAGTAASLDARASSDPEGAALTFSWDFGDGSRGGAAQIAHLYSEPGRYTVRLRVSDTQGAATEVTREITVTAAPAAVRQVAIAGAVKTFDGTALAGVSVGVQGSSASATSDAQGRVALSVDVGKNVVLRLTKPGHADQTKVLNLPGTVGADAYFEAVLIPRAAAQTLADAAAGGTLSGTDGARLTLPPAALVDAAGSAVTGAVDVTLTPVDINSAALPAFPGRFEGLNGDGTQTPIVSYGTVEFTLTQGGRTLQLKPGARATLELPIYASRNLDGSTLEAGAVLPLWSLDERSGLWVNEGHGTMVTAAMSPTGLAMRAEVGHLSWWNADQGYIAYLPKPRCINDVPGQYDSIFEQATICKMLAEMDKPIPAQAAGRDRGLAAAPRFPFPATRVDGDLPIGGGVAFAIPPNYDVVLFGSALNGTWAGRVKVRGSEGGVGEVLVPLRPVAQGGSAELISLPFDEQRAAAPARVDRYRFRASAGQGVEIGVDAALSTMSGTLRLLDPSGVLLMRFGFDRSTVRVLANAAQTGDYTIEIEPVTTAPAGYRLQAAFTTGTRLAANSLTATGTPGAPKVAANRSGDAVAAWSEVRGGVLELRASRYLSASGVWSVPAVVAPANGFNEAIGLQLGMDDAGNATLAWEQGAGPVVARLAAATQAWGAALPMASAPCPGGLAQRLAVGAQGDVVLLWQRSGAAAGLCSRHYAAAQAAWGAQQVLGVAVSTTQPTALALASTPDGRAVALWTPEATGLSAMRYQTSSASWGAPVTLTTAMAFRPSIAIAADGNALAVWQEPGVVQAAVGSAASALWAAPRRVGNSSSEGAPSSLWRGGTSFQVLWQSFNQGIRAVAYDHATALWGAEQSLAAGRLALLANAGSDGAGNVVAVWSANKLQGTGLELGVSRLGGDGVWVDAATLLSPRPLVGGGSALPDATSVAVAGAAATVVWREFLAPPQYGVVAGRFAAGP